MNDVTCIKEKFLSIQEKKLLSGHLKKHALSDNAWDLFDEFIAMSTHNADFFYIKVYSDNVLAGIGLFLKVKPYDLSTSNIKFRNNIFLKKIVSVISNISNNCVYFSFGFLTANLTRPFFFNHPDKEAPVLQAILSWLKQDKDADMVIIMDSSQSADIFKHNGFSQYRAPSEAWINPTKYSDISEYLKEHRSAKKHISQKKKIVIPEITQGPVQKADIDDMIECLKHSINNSKMNTPFQKIFEEKIRETELFSSEKYLFINIRIDNKIVGFTNYIISGSNMAAIIGGYNRNFTQNNYIYERLFVKSLEHAINKGLTRLSYGMVDNFTKLRLTGSFDPVSMYFYSSNPIIRKMNDLTEKSNDLYQLCLLEEEGMEKYYSNLN